MLGSVEVAASSSGTVKARIARHGVSRQQLHHVQYTSTTSGSPHQHSSSSSTSSKDDDDVSDGDNETAQSTEKIELLRASSTAETGAGRARTGTSSRGGQPGVLMIFDDTHLKDTRV